jgi:dolichol-phosphate mannosyltransferase
MYRNFISSELAFYDPDHDGAEQTAGPHLFGGSTSLMYEWWFPTKLQEDRALVLVGFDAVDLKQNSILRHVTRVGPVKKGTLTKNGKPIRTYFYRYAFGYRSSEQKDAPATEVQ